MGKVCKVKPDFLTVRLDDKYLDLVTAQFPKWLTKVKAKPDFKAHISIPLLYSFMDYLGKKSAKFADIPTDYISTTDPGTRQIYEYMKKRLDKKDQAQISTRSTKAKEKSTPEKVETTQQIQQIKVEEVHEDAPVQITSSGHVHGADEKIVNFYTFDPSSDGVEPSEQGQSQHPTKKDDEPADDGRVEFERRDDIKKLFSHLLMAHGKIDIGSLVFTWHRNGGHSLSVEPVKPTNDQQ